MTAIDLRRYETTSPVIHEPPALYDELSDLRDIADGVRELVKRLDALKKPILDKMAEDLPDPKKRSNIDLVNAAISDLNEAHWGFLHLSDAMREV